MDLNIIQTFVSAAKTQNFHETAEKLYIVQPTVSVHIKQLENHLGVKLFIKKGRNIVLTPAGQHFYPYAQQVLSEFEKGVQHIESWRQGYRQKIHLAVSPLIAASFLPHLIRRFTNKHPDIELSVDVVESKDISERVRSEKADIGLSQMKSDLRELTCQKLYEDPIIFVAPHDGIESELAPSIDIEQLIEDHFILTHNHPVYWEDLLMILRKKFPRLRTMKVSQVHVTKRFIEEGLGISFLPRSTVTRELLEGRVLEVISHDLDLPSAATYLLTKHPTKEVELFQQYIQGYL